MVLAQRVTLPGGRAENTAEVRMSGKDDAEQVPHFPLLPVGSRPQANGGGHVQVAALQGHLETDVTIAGKRGEMVDHSEIAGWLAFAMYAYAFVDGGSIQQHFVARTTVVAQVAQHRDDLVTADPQRRHTLGGMLPNKRRLPELLVQGSDHCGEFTGLVVGCTHCSSLPGYR